MPKKKEEFSDLRKKIIETYEENEYANLLSNRNRARSLNVGTAFGGIVEVSMRGDFHNLWCTLQPVEVVEIIEQLAASAGLEIAIRPRQDFATWRGWDADADHKYWAGSAHWQIGNIKKEEEKRDRLLKAKELKQLAASIKNIDNDEEEFITDDERDIISKYIGDRVEEIYEQADKDIESIRELINSKNEELLEKITDDEGLKKEYEEKREEEVQNYINIREKINKP
jgi:hypothetical protein